MPITENTPQRLVLRSGSTLLTLSRDTRKAVLQRKVLFWNLKPLEVPLSEIMEVKLDSDVDRASGIEVCATTLVLASGAGWALPAADKKDAQTSAEAIRKFLG